MEISILSRQNHYFNEFMYITWIITQILPSLYKAMQILFHLIVRF